jgi:hypothetical protein
MRLVHLVVTESDTEFDMRSFLQERVKSLELEDELLEGDLVSRLLSEAKGMFLWATLMVDELSNPAMDLEDDYNEALIKFYITCHGSWTNCMLDS